EEAVDDMAIHLALMGAIGIAEQRRWSRLGDDRLPPGGDFGERVVPGDGDENPRALAAGSLERRRQPVRRVDEFRIAIDLGAGESRGVGLVGVALDAHHAIILDMRQQRAHVWAIVSADYADDFHRPSCSGEGNKSLPGRGLRGYAGELAADVPKLAACVGV